MELISVLLSVYNESRDEIEKSIGSILNQTYKKIELILINDNPNNLAIDEIINNLILTDNRIRYIKNMTNLGLVKSLNKGLLLATGGYIARMDADDIASVDRLEKQLEYMKASGCDMVGSNIIKIDECGNTIGELRVPKSYDKIKKYQVYGSCILHPTWLVKREVYEKLGGYREIRACEDYDFIFRVLLNGYKIGNISEYGLYYRIRSSSISNSSISHQKVMSYYLADKYKRKETPSEEEVYAFIQSQKYKNNINKYERYLENKRRLQNKDLRVICSIVINKYFYKNIFEHYMQWERLK